jgi:hypothetical protein
MVMDASTAALQQQLLDQRPPSPTFDGIQVGVIRTVDGSSCTFVIPTFDPATFLGPAPLPAGVTATPGQIAIVAFVGPGANEPYVLNVYDT